MALDYQLLDVFTDTPLAGNPLAVFPDAGLLDAKAMQRIAGELNLSETVFVTEAHAHAGRFTIRIMTPKVELPFAGHPTIGAAVALADLRQSQGIASSKPIELIEPIGTISVYVDRLGDGIGRGRFAAPRVPAEIAVDVSRDEAAAMLGVEPEAVAPEGLRAWSAGVPFLCVPITSHEALAAVALNQSLWEARCANGPAPHVYAYVLDPEVPESTAARMFAPAMGVAEDPATGAAAIAFAGELAVRTGVTAGHVRTAIHQGQAIGRPSVLHVAADVAEGAVTAVWLSGCAVRVGNGSLTIPS
ncbi:PhzF family phenazine biosynthesis protein [Aquisalimonas sp.]|uniref:PhzF family phenazine biosynthesis protein n=1 Tax=Aquisalimonas sp. TaxID=1872621 RepID=UPI0025BD65C3|nr:PhzF family phenazine biosynthesis protein [Aquisalimonas sp.]